jgi:hypothetical protein
MEIDSNTTQQKEKFKQLLSESNLTGSSHFDDFERKWRKDERLKAVDTKDQRAWFEEVAAPLRKELESSECMHSRSISIGRIIVFIVAKQTFRD